MGERAGCMSGGLFHSIYATQSYKTQSASFDDRERIRTAIGERAERLAFLFCVSRRGQFFEILGDPVAKLHDGVHDVDIPVSHDELHDLIEIEIANYVEFMARTPFTSAELDELTGKVESVAKKLTAGAFRDIMLAIDEKRRTILPI
jgi:hypothetical protein